MNLRALRKRAGLRISDVSNDVRCSLSSVRNWEKGRTKPMMEVWQVFRLRDLYQCTEEELVQAVKASMLNEET
jgi:predicted transcriptional regulator